MTTRNVQISYLIVAACVGLILGFAGGRRFAAIESITPPTIGQPVVPAPGDPIASCLPVGKSMVAFERIAASGGTCDLTLTNLNPTNSDLNYVMHTTEYNAEFTQLIPGAPQPNPVVCMTNRVSRDMYSATFHSDSGQKLEFSIVFNGSNSPKVGSRIGIRVNFR